MKNTKAAVLLVSFLMFVPSAASAENFMENVEVLPTNLACFDASTLQINSTATLYNQTSGPQAVIDIETLSQNVNCPFGCIGPDGGARCANNAALMPLEIYIFILSAASVFTILSFMRIGTDRASGQPIFVVFFPFIAGILFLLAGFSSPFLLVDGQHFESTTLQVFFGIMGVVMLLIGSFEILRKSSEDVVAASQGMN